MTCYLHLQSEQEAPSEASIAACRIVSQDDLSSSSSSCTSDDDSDTSHISAPSFSSVSSADDLHVSSQDSDLETEISSDEDESGRFCPLAISIACIGAPESALPASAKLPTSSSVQSSHSSKFGFKLVGDNLDKSVKT